MPYKRKSKPTYSQRPAKRRISRPASKPSPLRQGKQPSEPSRPASSDALTKLMREPNELRRKLLFMGYLSKRLESEGVECLIVGGEAVEVYTAGQFTTGDIDIIVSNRGKAEKLLGELGFEHPSRVWIHLELGIAVDIVSSSLAGRGERVRTVKVGKIQVKMAAVEDLIVERLVSAKFWKGRYQTDLEQATVLLANFRDNLDLEYLERKASEQHVKDLYQAVSEKAKQVGGSA